LSTKSQGGSSEPPFLFVRYNFVYFCNMFNTVLYNLRSAKNIGLIARSHIAFGGDNLILISPRDSWKFNGGQHSYTRQLQAEKKLVLLEKFDDFLSWNKSESVNICIEIAENATMLSGFNFPAKCNLIFGSESHGLPKKVLDDVNFTVTIPQVGRIGSINVAQSVAIVQYEASLNKTSNLIKGNKFQH